MIRATVQSVSRVGGNRVAVLLIGPGPVYTEVTVTDLSLEVYEDLRAALCGGRTVTVLYQPGPPPAITGVGIHA